MPRSNLSKETLQLLESMWAEGMQNYSSEENKQKVQQISAATGLVDERIKGWIYHRNRKKKRLSGALKKASGSVKDLTPVDRDKFSQEVSDEAEAVGAGQEESRPGPDAACEEEEEEATRTILNPASQSQERQQETAAQLIQSVEDKIQKLQACNCEVLVMVYNHSSGSLYTTGTAKGQDFVNSQDPGIHWQFAGAMSNSSSEYNYN